MSIPTGQPLFYVVCTTQSGESYYYSEPITPGTILVKFDPTAHLTVFPADASPPIAPSRVQYPFTTHATRTMAASYPGTLPRGNLSVYPKTTGPSYSTETGVLMIPRTIREPHV